MLLSNIILLLSSKNVLTSAFTNGNFDQTDIDTAVTDHNDMRRQVAQGGYNPTGNPDYTFPKATDMIQLEWDVTLATTAKNWAANCNWQHSTTSYGENIAAKTGSSSTYQTMNTANLQSMIDGWLDDEAAATSFNGNGVNYDNLNCDTTMTTSCGHFTQGIWAETSKIGCGYQDCDGSSNPMANNDSWAFLVCNYNPPGNYLGQDVYTTGSTSCTSNSCPNGYTSCVNHLCASSTPSPTSQTQSPTTTPTPPPVVSPSNPDIYFCKYVYSGFNGQWAYDSTNKYTKTTPYSGYTNPFIISYDSSWNMFVIEDSAGVGWFGYCDQSAITSCSAGEWVYYNSGSWWTDSDAYISLSACPAPAQLNEKLQASHSVQTKKQVPSTTNALNITEMHIILGVLIIVLITLCGMIFGFCYYVRRRMKTGEQTVKASENEMVYFENKSVDEHNTPTVEYVKENTQTQPTLKINVNGAATMVTKLPTTTPVTPLIDAGQNYE